jgi:hypothetical protein
MFSFVIVSGGVSGGNRGNFSLVILRRGFCAPKDLCILRNGT